MPPFEPTISHYIFKLEQSVLMCCTCVCPGQRMAQIHTICDVSSVMLMALIGVMAHGTWDMAILAFQDLAFGRQSVHRHAQHLPKGMCTIEQRELMFVEREI